MRSLSSGLSDVCMSALPIPSKEKLTNITPKLSAKIGNSREKRVTISDSSTVFLRPIRFISTPVGTEKMRNQKKTREGKRLAVVSFRFKSAFT